jgi:hypothetical protein
MTMALVKAVDMAVKGEFPPDGVQIDGHSFYIRALSNKNRLEGNETGYFRHEHVGEDDRVFFSVKVKGSGTYEAKITRIEYRGFLNSGTKKYDLVVNGALLAVGPEAAIVVTILDFLKGLNLQSRLDGNWEVAAAKVVDAIGRRMAVKL